MSLDDNIEGLIQTLQGNSSGINLKSLNRLIKIRDLISKLLLNVIEDPDVNIRMKAAGGLGVLGPQLDAALKALLKALDDPEPLVRRKVAFALASIGLPALESLIKAIEDPDPEVCVFAFVGLGKLGPLARSAIPTLTKVLDHPDPDVKHAAKWALKSIGQKLNDDFEGKGGTKPMSEDRISGELNTEAADRIQGALQSIEEALPFVKVYSQEEKAAFLKPGEEMLAAARLLPDVMEQHKQHFPPDAPEAAELKRDLALHDALAPLANRLRALLQKVEDTDLAVQSDIAAALHDLYALSKYLGDRAPDLAEKLEPVRQVFKKRRSKKKESAASVEAQG